MTTKRIYLVTDVFADDETRYLVRASSAAAAEKHVTRQQYRVRVADQESLVAAMADGIKVEDAGTDLVPEAADETDTAGA